MTDASTDASPLTTLLDDLTTTVERAVAPWVLRRLIALAKEAPELSDDQLHDRLSEHARNTTVTEAPPAPVPYIRQQRASHRAGARPYRSCPLIPR
jgi:hypothetical protein